MLFSMGAFLFVAFFSGAKTSIEAIGDHIAGLSYVSGTFWETLFNHSAIISLLLGFLLLILGAVAMWVGRGGGNDGGDGE
jgi:hypothetical protein